MKSVFTVLVLLITSCSFAEDSTDKSKSNLSETKKTLKKALSKSKPVRVSPVTQSNRTSPNLNRKRPVNNETTNN